MARLTGSSLQSLTSAKRADNIYAAGTEVTFDQPPVAIHANQDGNLFVRFWGDSDTAPLRTVVVREGGYYPYSLKFVDSTSTVQFLAMYNVEAVS